MKDSWLAPFSDFVAARLGLHYPRERWPDLERALGAAARDWGFDDPAACAQWLMSAPLSPDQIEMLAHHLTIGETYFWREKRHFQVLQEEVLPALFRARRASGERRLRCWSAGCCTGEEPYSLAILLHRLLPDLAEWKITLLATDLNPRFLEKALAGNYSQWSFRDAPPWLKDKYFEESGKARFQIASHIRQMVTFARLNLAEDLFPSLLNNTNAMDVILCRNVLMYFNAQTRENIIGKFSRCLIEDGWLIVGPSETSQLQRSTLKMVSFPGAVFYRKTLEKASSAALFAPPPARPAVTRPTGIAASVPKSTPTSPVVAVQPAMIPKPMAPQRPAAETPDIYRQAQMAHEQGRYAEATALLRAAGRALKPAENALLARALANLGALDEALACCEQAVDDDKLHAGYRYLRATILQEQGDLYEAMKALNRALYLDHDFVLAHFALGHLAQRQGREREAKKQFASALHLAQSLPPDEVLPESDGITAGRLCAVIREMLNLRLGAGEGAASEAIR